MICIRCRGPDAHTEAECAAFEANGGPPLPAGICFRCAWEDPELRRVLGDWVDRKKAEAIRRARQLLVRPLEFIDQLVDSLR